MLWAQKKKSCFDPLTTLNNTPFLHSSQGLFSSHTGYIIEEFFSPTNFDCHCVATVMLIRLKQTPTETVTMIIIAVIHQLSPKPLSMAL